MDVLALWERVTAPALAEAALALATMTGLAWAIEHHQVRQLTGDALTQWETVLDAQLGYGVGLTASGLMTAQILLIFDDAATQALVSALVGEAVTLPLEGLGVSALAEVGNVVGTAFLNVFANQFQTRWEPSPPTVRHDTVAGLLAPVTQAGSAYVTEGVFRVADTAVVGQLVIVPMGAPT